MTTTKRTTRQTRTKNPAKHSTLGADIIQGLKEAIAIECRELQPAKVVRGPITARSATADPAPSYTPKKIKQLRESLELSQPVFAAALNVRPMTLRGWEQGTRKPDSAALRLLQLTEQHPEWLLAIVQTR